ncbi:hypothetical protein [Dermatophilus congolensis]|uniref:hypothetical protein n=1 Tax=Dermatophilus congolensis TaxID=1863 RepID=UPI001AAF1214|nr:hypothetical protein [Dermatophilus congolensis]MBO3143556.1 hypothetical protein [Dermatophilus congolensis]MBO3152547.1 hypothetical protein [Dermatophilus congolensis]MBO3160442.1 hypothetical protein [Dermatophilus congolensis]MBO3163833.1 hypothetical protein [Dermatophilus congolensis]MBO3177379.1 hypothetical protein [Dermatophilus congolensis]
MRSDEFARRHPEVAPEPIVQVTFDVDSDGTEVALVDGHVVVPHNGEDVLDAAVRQIAAMVPVFAGIDNDGHPYTGLKATLVGDDLSRFVVVYGDGRLFVPAQSDAGQEQALPDGVIPFPGGVGASVTELDLQDSSGDSSLQRQLEDEFAAHLIAPSVVVSMDGVEIGGAEAEAEELLIEDEGSWSQEPESEIKVARLIPPGTPTGGSFSAGLATAADSLLVTGQTVSAAGEETAAISAPKSSVGVLDHDEIDADIERPMYIEDVKAVGLRRWSWGRVSHRLALGAAGGVCALAVAGVLVSPVVRGAGDGSSSPAPVVSAPPGSTVEGSWSTGPLTSAAGPVVSVGDSLGYVKSDGTVALVDAATGRSRWEQKIVPAQVRGHLSRTRIRSVDSLAIHVGNRLVAWSLADGSAVAAVDLPEGAQVSYLGASPLVGTGSSTVSVLGEEGLLQVAVPAGAYALAARDDRSVTAVSSQGWWRLRSGVPAGAVRPFESATPDALPKEVRPRVVGYVGESVVLEYPAFGNRRAELVVHSDTGPQLQVAFRGVAPPKTGKEERLIGSPARTWGVYGRALVDAAGGSVSDLGQWRSSHVTDRHVYGVSAGRASVAGPGQGVTALPSGADVPEAESDSVLAVRVAGPARSRDGGQALAEGQQGVVVLLRKG